MNFRIDTSKGYTEAIIDNDCEFYTFENVATILNTALHIAFTNRANDFDTCYWDFVYNGSTLCLHYNIYCGLSILPTALIQSTTIDNENVMKVTNTLMTWLEDYNWVPFDDLTTIGTKGSEGGNIMLDLENIGGARITLEEGCSIAPFAVTLGIYGLMFHTHFNSNLQSATLFVRSAKSNINKLIEMYHLPEEKRTNLWQDKHDKLLRTIAEMTND